MSSSKGSLLKGAVKPLSEGHLADCSYKGKGIWGTKLFGREQLCKCGTTAALPALARVAVILLPVQGRGGVLPMAGGMD